MTRPRPHMPLHVKLEAALICLGLGGKKVEWDHSPALALREFDEATGKWTPDANDPRYIVPRAKEDHNVKTNGMPATTAGSDKNRISKLRQENIAKFLVNKKPPGTKKKDKRKHKWPSRPFPARKAA